MDGDLERGRPGHHDGPGHVREDGLHAVHARAPLLQQQAVVAGVHLAPNQAGVQIGPGAAAAVAAAAAAAAAAGSGGGRDCSGVLPLHVEAQRAVLGAALLEVRLSEQENK